MGDKNQKQANIPPAPNPVSLYKQFTNSYLGFQPTYLQNEDQFRGSEDPTRIAEQQGLQSEFGPTQYQQMLDAFNQLDPQYSQAHAALGNRVNSDLASGGQYAGDYNKLISSLQGQYNLGTSLSDPEKAQVEQGLRGSQAARGNIGGASAGIAEGYALGDRGQQLQQQRLGNYETGLGQGAQYAQQGINNAGSFLGAPTIAQQASFVPPVSPDRSFAYVNPNAGFQGVTLGNQAYANNVAAAGANSQSGGNPWMSTIGALGSVAGGLISSGAFSDRRLKTDIKKVGSDDKGGIYTFRYKGPKFVGRMAQELEQTDPGSVGTDPVSGYKMVTAEHAPIEVQST
jgi:hypothetical protein